MGYKIDTEGVEKEYGYSAPRSSGGSYFKLQEGANRIRIVTPLAVVPKHYAKNGYIGVCIGKDDGCPGCLRDDEIKKLKEQDPEGNKALQITRNIRWMCHVIDYGALERMKSDPTLYEDVVKLAEFPHRIAKMLEELQNDPDWTFDEIPMPYDIRINVEGAGKTSVKYSITPSPRREPLPQEYVAEIQKQKSPAEIVELMKDKKRKEIGTVSHNSGVAEFDKLPELKRDEEEINPEDIPF